MGPLLGALCGAIAGFISGLLSEKIRGRLIAIRLELQRVDDLQDAMNGVAYDLGAGRVVSPSALQRVDALRTRLGQNLRRVGYSSQGWKTVEAGLEQIQQNWLVVESAALDGVGIPLAAQGEGVEACESLRRRIHQASQQFPIYRLMGQR